MTNVTTFTVNFVGAYSGTTQDISVEKAGFNWGSTLNQNTTLLTPFVLADKDLNVIAFGNERQESHEWFATLYFETLDGSGESTDIWGAWKECKELSDSYENEYYGKKQKPSARELEVMYDCISVEETGYSKRYLMAENSQGQKAIYCIPDDNSPHYREVTNTINYQRTYYSDLVELIPPNNAKTWEGNGYSGGHNSQSYWNTSQEDIELFNLICSGHIVIDKTTEGNVSGYYPKIVYWQDEKAVEVAKVKSNARFHDDKNNLTLQKAMSL